MNLQQLQKRVSALEKIYNTDQQQQMYALEPKLENEIRNMIDYFDKFDKISETEFALHKDFKDGSGTVTIRKDETKPNSYSSIFYIYNENNALRCKAQILSRESLKMLSDFVCVIWRFNTRESLIIRLVDLLLKEQKTYKPSEYTVTIFGKGTMV